MISETLLDLDALHLAKEEAVMEDGRYATPFASFFYRKISVQFSFLKGSVKGILNGI